MRTLLALLILPTSIWLLYPKPKPLETPLPEKPISIEALVSKKAKKHQIPASLVHAIVRQESGYNPAAIRHEPKLKGASIGLMQIVDVYWLNSPTCPHATSREDLFDAAKNLDCGLSILASHLSKYSNTKKALIAYNGGHGCFKSQKCLLQASAYADRILQKS